MIRTILIGIAAAAAAIASLAATASQAVAKRDPQVALALWPANGDAAMRLAAQEMRAARLARMADGSGAAAYAVRNPRAEQLARRSLRHRALNPEALEILALSQTLKDDRRLAILRAANRLSRRELITQLFIIDYWARAGDSRRALDNYDALLRRRTPARDLAGRMLAQGVADPALRQDIVGLLRQSPPWASLLYYHLAREPGNAAGFVQLHRLLRGEGLIPIASSEEFAQRLLDRNDVEQAAAISELAAGMTFAPQAGVQDTAFDVEPAFPGNWTVVDPTDTSLFPLAGGGAILNQARNRAGTVAYRLVSLTPGRYTTSLTMNPASARALATDERPQARLSCAGAPLADEGEQILQIGADCPYQRLAIYLPESSALDTEVELTSITAERQ